MTEPDRHTQQMHLGSDGAEGLTAEDIRVVDAGGDFTATTVEGALAEILGAMGGSDFFTADSPKIRLKGPYSVIAQEDDTSFADIQLGSTPGFVAIDATNSISLTVVTVGQKHYLTGGSGVVIPILSADPGAGDSEIGQLYYNDVDNVIRWYNGTDWQDLGGAAAHEADTTDAHDASAISFSPTGTIAATDVQAAIAEVASESAVTAAAISALGFVGPILISDSPSTPLVFADLIQNEAEDDLVYADL